MVDATIQVSASRSGRHSKEPVTQSPARPLRSWPRITDGTPRSANDRELDWDDEIAGGDYVVIDKNWIEGKEIHEPSDWNPVQQLTTYLSALFEASENVGYVTDTWQNDEGKYLPTKGASDRTAGELIQLLNQCGGDIGSVIGDYDPAAGA